MATHTLATSSNLTAVTYSPSTQVLLPADMATIAQLIRSPTNTVARPANYFSYNGQLFIPAGLGHLAVPPGYVVAVDNQGWPILVSANSIANGNWTYT